MNKTFQINLGGYLFSIDDEAFEYINQYLSSLRKHFKNSESCEEILQDIEARMAELFQEQLNGKPIIGMKEVEDVVMVMGKPEDFGAEPIEVNQGKSSENQGSAGFTPGKRFYRDPDDKKLGGVCSGMSAYLGIEDPLWIRLLFVILFFTWGLGLMTYLILWILVPKANTSAEKLSMRGEPATFENIARVVEEDINDLGGKLKNGVNSQNSGGIRGILASVINFISTLLAALLSFVIKFFKVILIAIAVIMTFSLGATWIATILGLSVASPLLYNFGPTDMGYTTAGIVAAFLLIGIPAIMLILAVFRLLFRYKINRVFSIVATVIWFGALVTAGIVASMTAQEFQSYSETTSTTDHTLTGNELVIDVPETEDGEHEFGVYLGVAHMDGEKFKVDDIHFTIEKSKDSLLHITREVSARGRNRGEAELRASNIVHSLEVKDSVISLQPFLEIPQTDKYRAQKVEYTFYIPENKTITYRGQGKHLKSRSDFDRGEIHLKLDNTNIEIH